MLPGSCWTNLIVSGYPVYVYQFLNKHDGKYLSTIKSLKSYLYSSNVLQYIDISTFVFSLILVMLLLRKWCCTWRGSRFSILRNYVTKTGRNNLYFHLLVMSVRAGHEWHGSHTCTHACNILFRGIISQLIFNNLHFGYAIVTHKTIAKSKITHIKIYLSSLNHLICWDEPSRRRLLLILYGTADVSRSFLFYLGQPQERSFLK